jgi:hypothetical protein
LRGQTFDGASSGSLRIMQVFSPSLDFANPELYTPKRICIFVELSFKSLHNLVRITSLIEKKFDDH